jgi:hypothetical protein
VIGIKTFPLNYSLNILEFYTIFRATDSVIKQAINTLKTKKTPIHNTKGLCGNRSDTAKGIR